MRWWRAGWLLAALLAVPAGAAEVPDPTRPRPAGGNAPSGGPTASAGPAESGAEVMLQSVLVREDHRRAVINGERVGEGERVQGYRVVSIGERRVVLSGPDGRRELKMGGEGLRKRKVAPQ